MKFATTRFPRLGAGALPFGLCIFALAACVACAPTDTGNPPLTPSDASTDFGLVDAVFLFGGGATITGSPGSVTPPSGSVHVTNLDAEGEVQVAPVAADGSFSLFVSANLGDVLRLQLVDGAARSLPVDSADAFAATLIDEPSCLEMPKWIGFEAAMGESLDVSFEVTNRCDEAIEWGDWISRTGGELITSVPMSVTLAPGESRMFDLSITNLGQDGQNEEVLLLPILAPVESRRALTVTVTTP